MRLPSSGGPLVFGERSADEGGLSAVLYTRGRVAYLLSLSREDAIDEDACQPDSLARCAPGGPGSPTTHEEWDPPFAIAEWHDVHRAKDRVIRRGRAAEGALALELQLRGHTAREVGELLKASHVTAWRRARGLLDLILDELGGEASTAAAQTSQVEACLKCGTRPRARLRGRYRHVRGVGKVQTRPERQVGLCEECLPERLRGDVVHVRSWKAAA